MSLRTKIEKIEKRLGDTCRRCGALRDPARKSRASETYARYCELFEEKDAARTFAGDFPELAAVLGLPVPPPGVCLSCGADRRTPSEIEDLNSRIFRGYVEALASSGVPIDEAMETAKTEFPALFDSFMRRKDVSAMQYEDQLPATITDQEYSAWFTRSRIQDGVRVGPTLIETILESNGQA